MRRAILAAAGGKREPKRGRGERGDRGVGGDVQDGPVAVTRSDDKQGRHQTGTVEGVVPKDVERSARSRTRACRTRKASTAHAKTTPETLQAKHRDC